VGALPDLLPGYKPVSDAAARTALSEAWNAPIPGKAGLNTHQMFQNAATGQLKGLYIMGANPIVTFAGGDLAKRGLEKLDFLVVHDAFLSETAKLADVVLPAALFAEKEGTFTNWEGRVQHVRPSVAPPGDARPDDEILVDVAREMGSAWRNSSWENLLQEIGAVGGIYAGIAKADLDTIKGEGVLWPRKNGIDATAPPVVPDFGELKADKDYPVSLYWGNDTYHHGSLTSWDEGPRTAEGFAYVKVNPADARTLGVAEGDGVIVQSARHKIELPCKITDDVSPGQVFVPTTFPESPVNLLLDSGRILERAKLTKGAPKLADELAGATTQKAGVAG
jgi:predicted molibdopterin-dependent oxidoreductase YjgC